MAKLDKHLVVVGC